MEGFLQTRYGLLDHVDSGKMTGTEFSLYSYLILKANFRTGYCFACAETLRLIFKELSLKSVQRALSSMQKKQYIVSLRCHGQRGVYPILIHKYVVTDVSLSRHRLDAVNSSSLEDLKYSDVTDVCTEVSQSCPCDVTHDVSVMSPLYKEEELIIEERNKNKEDRVRVSQAPKTRIKNFIQPTIENVSDYAKEIGGEIDAERFVNYYQANGWKVGRNKMADWKATVKNWIKKDSEEKKQSEKKPNWLLELERQDQKGAAIDAEYEVKS